MSVETSLFTAALGLPPPWEVEAIEFAPEQGRIDFQVVFARGSVFACPACQAPDQSVHDTRERTWRHLNFFQYQAFIHAQLPRVKCSGCGKVSQVAAPWARPGSGFTLLFEALLITLAKTMPVNAIARLFGVGDDALWRVLDRYVETARQKESFAGVRAVGIDETACRRGQHYISLFHDMHAKRLLFACEGRDQSTVEQFGADLRQHGGDPAQVEAVSIDMSKAYIAGVTKHLPNAAISFDAFHVIALANEALEEVRREEAKTEPQLKGSRWLWLKDTQRLSLRQGAEFDYLSRTRLKTARAWRLKESLRALYQSAASSDEARGLFQDWYSWARRSRLEPFKRLANTLKEHLAGILNAFDSQLSNGRVEGINSMIQAAKARARGYATTRHLITIAYLLAGKLKHLPTSPFNTTSCASPKPA